VEGSDKKTLLSFYNVFINLSTRKILFGKRTATSHCGICTEIKAVKPMEIMRA
jgi:hypothetical protein